MRISFIVPAYNCELYIERCISSILRQELDSFEIIIVNDGSTDRTRDICDVIAAQHSEIRVIHTENFGVSVARNVGIRNANGKYVAFIDSDDYYKDDTIIKLLNQAEEQNLDIICGDYTEIGINGITEFNRPELTQMIMDGEEFVRCALSESTLPMVVWLSLFRRDYITSKELYFKPGYYYEDELWVSQVYLLASRICYCPINFYGYYIHNQSATHGKKYNKNAIDIIKICKELKEFSKQLKNQKTQELFQNYLITNYLSGYYLSRMSAKSIDATFFENMWMDNRNAKKVKLLLHAPHVYWYLNDAIKRIIRAKVAFSRMMKTLLGYKQQVFYLLKKGVREHTKSRKEKAILHNHTFSLISNTCNGGVITSELGEQFRSPTVNMYIDSDDFIELIENLEKYMKMELKEVTNRFVPFPVGEIGSVKIYFMHYKTFVDAKQKWDERKSRINYSNLFFLMAQRNGCTKAHIERFDKLPYSNKVIFTTKEYEEFSSAVYTREYMCNDEVDILTDCVGFLGNRKYDYVFDYVEWLNRGGPGKKYQK